MNCSHHSLLAVVLVSCLAAPCGAVWAQSQPMPKAHKARNPTAQPSPAQTDTGQLPQEVEAALLRAKVPREALHVVVLDTSLSAPARLSVSAQTPVNPASLMKLVTTTAALDLLGPAFVWRTSVYVEGLVRDATLQGNVYLRGSGDPRLVVERLWLLLRRLQGLGIQKIQGDIVLDRNAFDIAPRDAGGFDGEPLRPYNAAPDALLLNFKSLLIQFVPDRAATWHVSRSNRPWPGYKCLPACPCRATVAPITEVACAPIGLTLYASNLQALIPPPVVKKYGLSPTAHRRNLPHAPCWACGNKSADNLQARCVMARCLPTCSLRSAWNRLLCQRPSATSTSTATT